MKDSIMVHGKTTIWKAMVFIFTQMDEDMRENIVMIRNKDSVFISGLMVESMKVGGIKGNNTELELISIQRR
jgi:hypothetical protein